MRRRLGAAIAALALVAAAPAPLPEVPKLTAVPTSTVDQLPAGVSRGAAGAFVFRPANLAAPFPLVVMLHGFGGDARDMIETMRPSAERLGFVVLTPQSAGRTWDVIADRRFDTDPKRIDAALADLFARAPIRPDSIVIAGFSDGASYALSLGLSNPQLFRGVVAMSPGFATATGRLNPAQRIFIAHGHRDEVLAFSNTVRTIVPNLQAAGLKPRTHWFPGRHVLSKSILDEGLAYALGKDLG